MTQMAQKRTPGQLTAEKRYVVLTESTQVSEGRLVRFVHSCGTPVLAAEVMHPVWDGIFPLSGSGRVVKKQVPYCPKCEERPSYRGHPIYDRDEC